MLSNQENEEVKIPSWNLNNQLVKTALNFEGTQEEDGFSEKSSIDDYTIGKVIGTGAYAVVWVGMHKRSK